MVGVPRKQKLKDIWESQPYIIKRKIASDIPVYEVQMEGIHRKTRILHRNMLLPFFGIPDPDEAELPVPKCQPAKQDKSPESSDQPLSSSDFSDEDKDVDRDDKQAEP